MWLEDLRDRWTAALAHRGRCLRCGSERVWRNGVRWRKATVLDGDRAVYLDDVPVRRLRCGRCGARWSRAPERIDFFFQAEDGIRDYKVTGVQTCALPI